MKTGNISSILIAIAVGWFALSPVARALCREGCDSSLANTFLGDDALVNNTTGFDNTAIGYRALELNTEGSHNAASGLYALSVNTTGSNNTANGAGALEFYNGSNNTATGFQALNGDVGVFSTGTDNTAIGVNALYSNTGGGDNTATGSGALLSNTDGVFNTADGAETLVSNMTGNDNTATGVFSLFYNTTGNDNTANGYLALNNNATGSRNIALGYFAGGNLTTGSDNIDIGNAGVAGESAKIRIGTKGTHRNTYIAGIYGVTATRGVGVFIDSNGHLGTTTSSARFKDNIKPMDKASGAILSLQPVTFCYKKELDPEGIPQFGLVAEEVAKVNPDLVARDEEGKPYTVRYEAVNAMLLNEFLKEHRKVQEQEATITELKSRAAKQEVAIAQQEKSFEASIAQQHKQIETLSSALQEQALQIQKVSAQLAASDHSALRIVANDQSTTK